jgi:superfamily II DNA helicase RecQ
VHLLTYHRAKGLEFESVFLPRLEDKELPSRLARSADEQAEERRLLYVGVTRAKRRLAVTWSRRPSPFLLELGVSSSVRAPAAAGRVGRAPRNDSPAAESLRRWRLERARADEVPPYVIFPDRTIDELLAQRPATGGELAAIHGLGPARLSRFGEELLGVMARVLEHADEAVAADRPTPPEPAPSPLVSARPAVDGAEPEMYAALASWRRRRASDEAVPAYHVFANRVLEAIAAAKPRSPEELLAVPGVGPAKLERYGAEVLEVVAAA